VREDESRRKYGEGMIMRRKKMVRDDESRKTYW
jgi:hypothetical protein